MKRTAWIVVALGFLNGAAFAGEFVVSAGQPNRVVFVSKAATETFEGKTDRIDGRITVDPAGIDDSVSVHFEVDLASLDTGIGKRNQHMRDNHLETKQYPKAIFDGASVLEGGDVALALGTSTAFECEGNFTLHGVTRRLRTSVEVTLRDAKTLVLKAEFAVPLADYNISRPKFLFLKLGDVQTVTVEAVAIASH